MKEFFEAASGIGRAASVLFSREGATLVLSDWNEEALNETLGLVLESGGRAVARKTDVSNERDVRELIGPKP